MSSECVHCPHSRCGNPSWIEKLDVETVFPLREVYQLNHIFIAKARK